MKHFRTALVVLALVLVVGVAVTALAQGGLGNEYGAGATDYRGPMMGYDQGYTGRMMEWVGCLMGGGPGNGRHMMDYGGSRHGRCR